LFLSSFGHCLKYFEPKAAWRKRKETMASRDLEERLRALIKDVNSFVTLNDPHVPVAVKDEFHEFRSKCVANLEAAAQAMHSLKAAKPNLDFSNY